MPHPPHSASTVKILVTAALATLVATLLRMAMTPLVGEHAIPFITYFPAVLFAAWYAGFRAAVLTVLLSGIAAAFYFSQPTARFGISQTADQISLGVFAIAGLGIATLGHLMKRAASEAARESLQRKDAEDAERALRERLQVTLSSIGDAVLSTDASGIIVFANRVALSVLGVPETALLGKHLDDVFRIVNEFTRQPVESPVAKVLREGGVVGLANHTVLLTPGGREVPIDDSAAPIRGPGGAIQGTVLVFRDVTERRKAEQTSRLLSSIVASSDDAIISKDVTGIVTSWNKGAERIFGYSAQEMIGHPIAILAAPGREYEMPEILQRLRAGERVDHYETVRRAKDGRLIDISLTVSPVLDTSGTVVGASKIGRDITERKRAEERLRRGEAEARAARDWLRTTLSSIGDGVITTDPEGRITFMNAVAESLTGWPQEEALGAPLENVFAICSEETGEPVESPVAKVLRQGQTVGLANHTRLTAKTGRQIPIDDSAAPIRDEAGVTTGVVLVFRDITERKQTEYALRESLERFELMANSAPVLIWIAGLTKECTWFNKPWLNFVGRGMEQEIGTGWAENVHPDDYEGCLKTYIDSFDARQTFTMEYRLRRHDGQYRWVLDRGIPLHGAQGEFTGYIGSCIDITEQKHTEQDLRRANEDLKQFAFAASHDLQEPLRMITNYAQLLLEHYPAPDEAEPAMCVKFISQGTQRMQALLADLLEYTQLSSGDEIPVQSVDLNTILQKTTENLKAGIEDTGADIASERLPRVAGHEAHFLQLFQNIIGNALKYRKPAEPPLIRISVAEEREAWRFAVSDNGIGIPPKYHQQIFGVFKRLHGSAIPGTGIGLAICQRVVHRYGGRIWVESEVNQGSTFYFTLPVNRGADER